MSESDKPPPEISASESERTKEAKPPAAADKDDYDEFDEDFEEDS